MFPLRFRVILRVIGLFGICLLLFVQPPSNLAAQTVTSEERQALLMGRVWQADSGGAAAVTPEAPFPQRTDAVDALVGTISMESTRNGGLDIYLQSASDPAGTTSLVTTPGNNVTPVWSPDGSQMVFASDRDGDFDIYLRRADGYEMKLTQNSADDAHPSWSPDGQRILFTSDLVGPYFQIYTMRPDGSDLQGVAYIPGVNAMFPRYSPNGTQIAFMRASTVSPLCQWNWDVWVMNADGSQQQRLTTFLGADIYPTWTPDGSKVTYARCDNFIDFDLYQTAVTTGIETQLTSWLFFNEYTATYSPDGEHLAFTSDIDGNLEIYGMPVAGGLATNLTQNPADEAAPSWQSQPYFPQPAVIGRFPAIGAVDVDPNTAVISATFNVPMNGTTINDDTFIVTAEGQLNRIGTITYDELSRTAEFVPNTFTPLHPGTVYDVILTGDVRSATSPPQYLPLTRWQFTTTGEGTLQVEAALAELRQQTHLTIDHNALLAAKMLATARDRTSTSWVRLGAEWIMTVLSFSSLPSPPPGLPESVTEGLKFFKGISISKHVADSALWMQQVIDDAPEDEAAAFGYFVNRMDSDLTLQDERSDGTVVWSGTGYDALKAAIDAEYAATIAALPNDLTAGEVADTVRIINQLAADVQRARSVELYTTYCDDVDAVCRQALLGGVNTFQAQFDDVLANWETVSSIKNTIFGIKVAGWGLKIGSTVCVGASVGICTPLGAPAFAASEYAVWGGGLAGGAVSLYELTMTPREMVLFTALRVQSAAVQENIQLRRLFNGTTWLTLDGLAAAPKPAATQPEAVSAIGVTLDALNLPSVNINGAAQIVDVDGTLTVQNGSAANTAVSGIVLVAGNGSGTGADTISATNTDQVTIPAGATAVLPFTIQLPPASLVNGEGFEAQAVLLVEQGQKLERVGPLVAYFTVDSAAATASFAANAPQALLMGTLAVSEQATAVYNATDPFNQVRFTLIQPGDVDFDLHIYDGYGRHIGYNYAAETNEIPADAAYSGKTAVRETIDLPGKYGPYTIVVIAANATTAAPFQVSVYEQPPYTLYLPVILNPE